MRCRKNIHSVSRLGIASKLALLSLLTELYNFYFCVVSLSQNAHPVVKKNLKRLLARPLIIDGSFNYPSTNTYFIYIKALASCTTNYLFYVNLLKERFF